MKRPKAATLIFALAICVICILMVGAFAAITLSVTIQSSGTISYSGSSSSSDIWVIGQYSNGEYYSITPAGSSTESSSASSLINTAISSASLGFTVNQFFSNSFQSDSFKGWSSTNGSPTIVTSPVYSGCTYSAEFNEGGTGWNYKYCTENVASTSAVDVKEYVNFATLTNTRQFAIEVSGSGGEIAYAGLLSNTEWGILDDTTGITYSSAASTISSGQWYCIELTVFLGSGTGSLQLSVNGVQVAYATGLNNSGNGNVASVSVGAFDWGTAFEDYVDSVTMGTPAMLNGGTVTINPGSYCLSQTLVPQNNVYLNVSSSATLYQNTPSSLGNSISLMYTTNSVRNFVVNGGVWNGNKGSLSDFRDTSTWAANFHLYFGISIYSSAQSSDITIENLTVENVIGQGIDMENCYNALVYNCTVINAGDNPITLDTSSSNSMVEYCTVVGGQDVGINTWDASNCTLRYNTVSNVTEYSAASHWGMAAEQSTNIDILNNKVYGCEYDIVSTSDDTLIQGNNVNGNNYSNFGIQIQNAANNIVSFNTITGCSNGFGTYTPITETLNLTLQGNVGLGSGYQTLNVTITGSGSGTISETSSWCDQGLASISGNNWQFPTGSTVVLTANPTSSSTFDHFTLTTGTATTSNPLSVVMSGNEVVTVYFDAP